MATLKNHEPWHHSMKPEKIMNHHQPNQVTILKIPIAAISSSQWTTLVGAPSRLSLGELLHHVLQDVGWGLPAARAAKRDTAAGNEGTETNWLRPVTRALKIAGGCDFG